MRITDWKELIRFILAVLLLLGAAHVGAVDEESCFPSQPRIPAHDIASGCPLGTQLSITTNGRYFCVDNYSVNEDVYNLLTGINTVRDLETGNILALQRQDTGQTVVEYGDYDSNGRPHWYDDGFGRVVVTWRVSKMCEIASLSAAGWTSRFTWNEGVPATIDTPLYSRPAHYEASYYPDQGLKSMTLAMLYPNFTINYSWTYGDEEGTLLASTRWLGPAQTTAAATAAATATPPAPLDPKWQPKVSAVRAPPGAALRLLGPLQLLYPAQLLTDQIVRFHSNMVTAANVALVDKCDAQLFADRFACRKFWIDRGFQPDDLPLDDHKVLHHDCMKSADERHASCMAGNPALELRLPFTGAIGNDANMQCARDYGADRNACRSAALVKYPGGSGSMYPTLYTVDLYGCILSAQRRLAQCYAGVPLAARTPLKLP